MRNMGAFRMLFFSILIFEFLLAASGPFHSAFVHQRIHLLCCHDLPRYGIHCARKLFCYCNGIITFITQAFLTALGYIIPPPHTGRLAR
ncbi:hypothetical protein V1506DRAFT_534466 [Lipomyces tetrasporus]